MSIAPPVANMGVDGAPPRADHVSASQPGGTTSPSAKRKRPAAEPSLTDTNGACAPPDPKLQRTALGRVSHDGDAAGVVDASGGQVPGDMPGVTPQQAPAPAPHTSAQNSPHPAEPAAGTGAGSGTGSASGSGSGTGAGSGSGSGVGPGAGAGAGAGAGGGASDGAVDGDASTSPRPLSKSTLCPSARQPPPPTAVLPPDAPTVQANGLPLCAGLASMKEAGQVEVRLPA